MRIFISIILLLLASDVSAQQAKEIKTTKGKPAGLINLINQSTDCKLGAVRLPIVSEPPKFGSIQMQAGIANIAATGSCPAQTAPVIALIYIPVADFIGSDSVNVDIVSDNKTTRFSYSILVQAESDKL